MRFLDYNGNGGLDPQDIATSVAVGEARREEAATSVAVEGARHEEMGREGAKREEEAENAQSARPLSENAGCATMAAFMALPIIAILLVL